MRTARTTSRALGVAFLLQAIASLISGAVLFQPLIASGNISQTMTNIAIRPWLMKASILGQMITAMGIVFLGAVLFSVLRRLSEKIALTALGLYILEAALIAASEIASFSLLRISQEYVSSGQPAFLQTLGNLAYEFRDYGRTLDMVACGVGAILFYYLLVKSRLVPRILSLWGLVTMVPVLAATLSALFGYRLPIAVYAPYVPFEFFIGAWILFKGLKNVPETAVIAANQAINS